MKKFISIFIIIAMVLSFAAMFGSVITNTNSVAIAGTTSCSWQQINKGLYNGDVYSLAIDPNDTNIIYAGK